jgi:hypothetical protein
LNFEVLSFVGMTWDELIAELAIQEAHDMARGAMRYAVASQLRYRKQSARDSALIARSLERINASQDRLATPEASGRL